MRGRAGIALVAVTLLSVLSAGVGVLVVRSADTTSPYDEQAALDAFRARSPQPGAAASSAGALVPTPSGTGSPAPTPGTSAPAASVASPVASPAASAAAPAAAPEASAPREVPPGVYRYDTAGHEQVDALGGARHDYPAVSTITYTRRGCGTEQRWQPLEERVGVTLQCDAAAGPEVRSTYQERSFFGQRQAESYACLPGTLAAPRDPRPGQTWQGRCRSDDSTVDLAGSVVALEDLVVDGRSVPVVRVRVDGTLTGSTRGRTTREAWLARADGLLVRMTASTDTVADTAGGAVRYQESYTLQLQSLAPRR